MKLIIFGASGGTGQEAVKQALEQGHEVTAFLRNPEKFPIVHERLSVFRGDVLDPEAVEKGVRGHNAVLSTLGTKPPSRQQLVGPGTSNIIQAMKRHNIRRLIVESAFFMDDEVRRRSLMVRLMVKTFMKGLYADKLQQDRVLLESGLEWINVRPTRLTNGPKKDYRAEVGLSIGGMSNIARSSVADFMLKQISSDEYLNKEVLLSE